MISKYCFHETMQMYTQARTALTYKTLKKPEPLNIKTDNNSKYDK